MNHSETASLARRNFLKLSGLTAVAVATGGAPASIAGAPTGGPVRTPQGPKPLSAEMDVPALEAYRREFPALGDMRADFMPGRQGDSAMQRVMVFGVFDGLHEGHRVFLRQAREHGDTLTVVVTHDHLVRELKGRPPTLSLAERIRQVLAEPEVDEAVPGDEDMSSWRILERCPPDVIALGYDQGALREDLERQAAHLPHAPRVLIMEPYKPEIYHTSLLRDKPADPTPHHRPGKTEQ